MCWPVPWANTVACGCADSCTLEMQLYIEEVDSELQALLPPTGALWNLALRLANTEVRPHAVPISLASLEPRAQRHALPRQAPGWQGALQAPLLHKAEKVLATSRHAAHMRLVTFCRLTQH